MKKEDAKEEKIRKMLKEDNYKSILYELTEISEHKVGDYNKSGIIHRIAKKLFPGKNDGVSMTISAFESFEEYGVTETYGNVLRVTNITLRYASRKSRK
jgi:hypothetical protein